MIGVGHILSVTHKDIVRKELHGHSYEVIAWFETGDAVGLQKLLGGVVRQLDHTTLPDEMTRAEEIGRWIGTRLPGCLVVDVNRPLKRIYCCVKL
jgi:6-pyruvoyl-tetrahydropterin synthase